MRTQDLSLADPLVLDAVLDLQRRSYRVEAQITGIEVIPGLRETAAELASCGESFIGAEVDGTLAGIVSYRIDGSTLDIHRMAVDPAFFRRGVARALLAAALALPHARAVVSTGAGNAPARGLYESAGFRFREEFEVQPEVCIWRFTRP